MEKIELKDMIKYKSLSGVKYAPDGKNIGFVLHEMDEKNNRYLSNIYIYNLDKDKTFKLTSGDKESQFIFKDDKTVLFSSLRDKVDQERKTNGEQLTCYYEISIEGGEAQKVFEIGLNVSEIERIDDDTFIVKALYDVNAPVLDSLSNDEKDYEVIDEIPFWQNGKGYSNKKRNRLYIFNKKANTLKPITETYTNVEYFTLKPDKSKVVFIGNTFKDKMELGSGLYEYTIEAERLKDLSMPETFKYSFVDFIKDDIIFAGSDMEGFGINKNDLIYLLNGTGEIKALTDATLDYSLRNTVGSDTRYGSYSNIKTEDKYLYFTTTEHDSSYINRIDRDGNCERVTKETGAVDGFDVFKGQIAFIGLRGNKLQELYKFEDQKETQLTQFNQWVVETKKISTPEKLVIKTDEGITIEGWLMKPVSFDENKKYPGILNIHGGPKAAYGAVFFHEMQYWANEGYAVFFCNPRGSDGRGNEFSDIRGRFGDIDYKDIMQFTDAILDQYAFIDKNRLGVTGGSYGGYMTNWIIGHTDRFKAAVSQRSISNWISKFCTTDIGYYFVADQQASTPWTDMQNLWDQSPLKFADKVKTPTLFIHSEEDYRCWMAEGLQMFTALKYHGVESRLCLFREENHELSRSGKPKHRIRRLKEITEWFDRYLK
ncbi:alpha/beta hydrolase family protein [Fusibacter ferrireducens]|uniref:S9 family peptidase n=1 Tax=Fusibacter ferrireducens TaxID=2785058 RepID=A0ABR9ZYK9_9FIRM|nr:S9 family peptidase [Fusibacter ferrireducens]MBF4695540.1 S9 family peptidase [Fusibacter ferrireducens]